MNSSQLDDFFRKLPEIDSFIGKNLYIWGIGDAASLYQEGLVREKELNICGYTVSKGYEVSNYTYGGVFLRKETVHPFRSSCR